MHSIEKSFLIVVISSAILGSVASADVFKGKDILVTDKFTVVREPMRNILIKGDAAERLYKQMGSAQLISLPGAADNIKQSANIKCIEAIVNEPVTYLCEMHIDSKGNLGAGRAWGDD